MATDHRDYLYWRTKEWWQVTGRQAKGLFCFVLFFTRLDNQMLIHEVLRASLTVDNKEVTGEGGLAPKLPPMQQQLLQKQQEQKPKGSQPFLWQETEQPKRSGRKGRVGQNLPDLLSSDTERLGCPLPTRLLTTPRAQEKGGDFASFTIAPEYRQEQVHVQLVSSGTEPGLAPSLWCVCKGEGGQRAPAWPDWSMET